MSVSNISEFREVFALLPLPNCPRLNCRVFGLVSIEMSGLVSIDMSVKTRILNVAVKQGCEIGGYALFWIITRL